jgi:uncharacterized membrane protein YgdD (TMEM256/DUF423 family)
MAGAMPGSRITGVGGTTNLKPKHWILAGGLAGGLAVALGAFAAHALKDRLHDISREPAQSAAASPATSAEIAAGPSRSKTITAAELLAIFETGARYQMYHALVLVLVGLLAPRCPGRAVQIAGWAFLAGIVLFSGSLYALVLLGNPRLGMITPLGGAAFIVGWLALAAAAQGAKEL